jgi:NhaP-type Na+/H+ or K+/H+ antiporter
MLLAGLPGVIFLGTVTAAWLFDTLALFKAAILGTMLAATDAALGKAVVTNEAVPMQIREGLNVESGLNDGLCVPILFVFIVLALGNGGVSANPLASLMGKKT